MSGICAGPAALPGPTFPRQVLHVFSGRFHGLGCVGQELRPRVRVRKWVVRRCVLVSLLVCPVRGREDLVEADAGSDVFDRLVCLLEGGRPDRAHGHPELVDLSAAERRPDGVARFLEPTELLVGQQRRPVQF